MEAIIVIVLFLFGGFILKSIVAGGKSIVTGQSFAESYRGFPDWSLKIEEKTFNQNPKFPIKHKEIFCRGLIPIHSQKKLGVLVRLLDVTDTVGEKKNNYQVITFLDKFQAPNSTIFEFYQELGTFYPDTGFKDWVRVATIPHEFLQSAYGGQRKIKVFCIIEDTTNPYTPENTSGVVSIKEFNFTHNFKEKGYLEASQDIETARGLAVKIAVGVAMSDGFLDDKEGETIKNWIKKTISIYDKERADELKVIYNEAFKEAYKLAKRKQLLISDLTDELNNLNEEKIKYDAMELCYEVMAADGVAETKELKVIREIGDILNIDANEIEKMRDKNLVNLSTDSITSPSVEDVLGIDKNWPKDKIKEQLTSEFKKWNSRMTSLPEGDEKSNAQSMLNKIADLRKKYGI